MWNFLHLKETKITWIENSLWICYIVTVIPSVYLNLFDMLCVENMLIRYCMDTDSRRLESLNDCLSECGLKLESCLSWCCKMCRWCENHNINMLLWTVLLSFPIWRINTIFRALWTLYSFLSLNIVPIIKLVHRICIYSYIFAMLVWAFCTVLWL